MNHSIPAGRPDLVLINKKKQTCNLADFAVPVDYREKMKESQKTDKYLDLSRKQRNLWNMLMMMITNNRV